MASHPNILVFDSGIGGLSIVDHIHSVLPNLTVNYLADYAYFPYGLLDEATLTARTCALLAQAYDQYRPSLMVIACNSASTLALPKLRQLLPVDIVGVVPAIKPAAITSVSKTIGLLATPGTIQRDYTDDLIAEFAPDCTVIKCGSSALVDLAEAKLRGQTIESKDLSPLLQPLLDLTHHTPTSRNIDTVVLACTHFPLLKPELASAMPGVKHWIDSGEAIARRVASLLDTLKPEQHTPAPSAAVFISSKAITDSQKALIEAYGYRKFTTL